MSARVSRLIVARDPFGKGGWTWRLVGADGQTLQRASLPFDSDERAMATADGVMAARGMLRRLDSVWQRKTEDDARRERVWWERPL